MTQLKETLERIDALYEKIDGHWTMDVAGENNSFVSEFFTSLFNDWPELSSAIRTALSDSVTPGGDETEKRFPVISSPEAPTEIKSVPWQIAEEAYAVYSARFGTSQPLERLAERGGFHSNEMDHFLPDWRERVSEWTRLKDEVARLEAQVAALQAQPEAGAGLRERLEELRPSDKPSFVAATPSLDEWRQGFNDAIDQVIESLALGDADGWKDSFQNRVAGWMQQCFTPEITADKLERNDRFIEESLELVQSIGYSAERAHALVDYVFSRDVGEPIQELGGVMVTLAALCNPNRLDMIACGERELERILQPEITEKIRKKQAAKPTGSALPSPPADTGNGGGDG